MSNSLALIVEDAALQREVVSELLRDHGLGGVQHR
jgi:CheY-like chemotaxis protein